MREVIVELSVELLHKMLKLPYGVSITDVMFADDVLGIRLEGGKFPIVPDGEPIPNARIEYEYRIRFVTVKEEKIDEGS